MSKFFNAHSVKILVISGIIDTKISEENCIANIRNNENPETEENEIRDRYPDDDTLQNNVPKGFNNSV